MISVTDMTEGAFLRTKGYTAVMHLKYYLIRFDWEAALFLLASLTFLCTKPIVFVCSLLERVPLVSFAKAT